MSGSCVQVQKATGVKHILAELKILNYKFSFTQVLPVSHLCAHLPHSHHVLDIILDQTRGEEIYIHHVCYQNFQWSFRKSSFGIKWLWDWVNKI